MRDSSWDIAMPMLVIPERTVHTIPDLAALAHLVQRLKRGWKLHQSCMATCGSSLAEISGARLVAKE